MPRIETESERGSNGNDGQMTLVTGATGFLGSAIVRQLIRSGHKVKVLVRPTSDLRNIRDIPVKIVMGDLTNRASLEKALKGCAVLFHVAADYRLWVPDPEEMYRNNVRGTQEIMEEALKAEVRRIIYTSSVATLKLNANGRPTNENSTASLEDMIGHYKRSKFLAEAVVLRLVERRGLPAVIVNPSTPVGPRDVKPTPTGRFIVDAASGRIPAYVNTGLNIVHVDDVASGHLLALRHGKIGERYVLGGHNMSLKEILSEVTSIAGCMPPRIRLPHKLVLPLAVLSEAWARFARKGEPRITLDGAKMAKKHMFFSSEKAKQELGYSYRPAKEALCDAVSWFRQNGYVRVNMNP
jgi:dihydroflavonol-4-reductase